MMMWEVVSPVNVLMIEAVTRMSRRLLVTIPPICGGNELQRNRFAGCQRMWAACRCAYRDELAYLTVAGTLSIFDLPKPHGCVTITVPIAREAKHLVRSERDHTCVPLK